MMKKKEANNTVVVACERKTFRRVEKKIAHALREALFFEKIRGAYLTVHLVSDVSMKRINKETRKKDMPTNVLSFVSEDSFPHPELSDESRYYGDIFLAPSYISKKKQNLFFLAVHGLLHLLGYDHEKKSDRMIMEAREKEILLLLSSLL